MTSVVQITRRKALLLGAVAMAAPLIARPARADTTYLVIVTGGTGGVFYPYGGGLAQLFSSKLPDVQATAEVTGGSVDNVKLVGAGDAELGFSTLDSAYDGLTGVAAYADVGPQAIAQIAVLYDSVLHVVASKESGIATIADLKGKRLSVGSAGSSTETIADRILAAAGLDPMADVTRDNLSVAESAGALSDGKIDAFFWIGGIPTPAIKDLASAKELTFISTGDVAPRVLESHPGLYSALTVPKDAYSGLTEDVDVLGVANILFVNQGLDGEMVTAMLAAIFDNLESVHAFHPAAKTLTLEGAARTTAVPFHPAAVEFFAARGITLG